ncbi:MAG: hypothetical protein D6713_02560 [Deltaproteobacteria bacterium]|nr:MAG: hypothetical protein D6713_02560 [Deltaproteobacteria bacterium]
MWTQAQHRRLRGAFACFFLALLLCFPISSMGRSDEVPPTYQDLLKNYREVRRKYRTLEFLSLGIFLAVGIGLTLYAVKLRQRRLTPEEAAGAYPLLELGDRDSCRTHLKELSLKSHPVAVRNLGGTSSASAVIAVNESDETFILEPISFPVTEGEKVIVEYIYEEVPYSFITSVESIGKGDEVSLQIPYFIKYTQRRKARRKKPLPLEEARVILPGGMTRSVIDVGPGGIGFEGEDIRAGTTITLGVTLPGSKLWKVEGKVVYAKEGRTGFAFTSPPSGFLSELALYLSGRGYR